MGIRSPYIFTGGVHLSVVLVKNTLSWFYERVQLYSSVITTWLSFLQCKFPSAIRNTNLHCWLSSVQNCPSKTFDLRIFSFAVFDRRTFYNQNIANLFRIHLHRDSMRFFRCKNIRCIAIFPNYISWSYNFMSFATNFLFI